MFVSIVQFAEGVVHAKRSTPRPRAIEPIAMSEDCLKAVVADLHAMRYRTSDIARVLKRSRQHINRILRDLDLHQRPLRGVDDLPPDMRTRVCMLD